MNGDVIHLDNHLHRIQSAEEALDFNFNEPCDSDDINEILVVPFVHFFKHQICSKTIILVEGKVLTNAISFRFDFCNYRDDIIFHLNPRLDQKYVARNTLIEGQWDDEEGYSVTKSPLQRGKLFQFQIYILDKEYLVGINGQHMFSYKHRLSPSLISRLEINGDIELTKVNLFLSSIYPLPSLEFSRPENSLTVPVIRALKNGFGFFGKIIIKARVKLLPVSFYINIQSGNQVYPHPKIIYHLNFRYLADGFVVQNSWGMREECWDEELRSPIPQALYPGSEFSLSIETNKMGIQTRGPDWELPGFYHRLNPETGLFLYIQGDVILKFVKVLPDNSISMAL